MSLALKQLKVYARVIIMVAVAAAVALVLLKNRNHRVSFWFFWLTDDAKPVNVIFLMILCAAGTLASYWVLSRARRLGRDVREMRRLRVVEQAARKLDQWAAELDERERRIDTKLQRAITEEQEDGNDKKPT